MVKASSLGDARLLAPHRVVVAVLLIRPAWAQEVAPAHTWGVAAARFDAF